MPSTCNCNVLDFFIIIDYMQNICIFLRQTIVTEVRQSTAKSVQVCYSCYSRRTEKTYYKLNYIHFVFQAFGFICLVVIIVDGVLEFRNVYNKYKSGKSTSTQQQYPADGQQAQY